MTMKYHFCFSLFSSFSVLKRLLVVIYSLYFGFSFVDRKTFDFCLTKTTLMREGRTLKKKRSKVRKGVDPFVGYTPFILGIKLRGHCLIDSDTTELIKAYQMICTLLKYSLTRCVHDSAEARRVCHLL